MKKQGQQFVRGSGNNAIVKKPSISQHSIKHQRGFSLIEALVAFLIVSIGMLGIASLQTISMRAGHTAITRTSAIISAQNILDRMRANPTQLTAYTVTTADTGTDNSCNDVVDYASHTVSTSASNCTPTQIAEDDIFHWKNSLGANLSGAVTVVAPVAPRVLSSVTVVITWNERDTGAAGVATANSHTVVVEM